MKKFNPHIVFLCQPETKYSNRYCLGAIKTSIYSNNGSKEARYLSTKETIYKDCLSSVYNDLSIEIFTSGY
jgi:hypothetical protein